MEAILGERNRRAHGVEQAPLVDAREHEASLVERLGALGAHADADRRKRAADAREEARLLREGTGVRDDAVSAGLQLVIVVEAHGLVGTHQGVRLEARGLQALAGAGVAAVEDGLSIFLGEGVYRAEEGREVRFGVNVLLAVGGEQEVASRLQALALQHVAAEALRQSKTAVQAAQEDAQPEEPQESPAA